MFKVRKIIILISFLSSIIFGVLFSNLNVYASVVPSQVEKEVRSRCINGNAGTFISAWLSSNPDGSGLLSYWDSNFGSVNVSNLDVDISQNKNVYVNYAHMTCAPWSVGRKSYLTNLKILKREPSTPSAWWDEAQREGYNTSGNDFIRTASNFRTWGEGGIKEVVGGPVKNVRNVYRADITLDSSRLKKKGSGIHSIFFVVDTCVAYEEKQYSADHNFRHSIRGDTSNGLNNCFALKANLKVNVIIPKKYQTQARSYVKVKQGDKTVRETVGKQGNGPIVAKVGEKIEFNHQLINLGDATDDTIDQVIIRGLRDYGPAHGIIGTDHLSLYNYAKKNNIKRANKGNDQIFAEAGDGKNNQMNSNYLGLTIRPEHVGKTFCTDITWTANGGHKNMGAINDNYQSSDINGNSATYPACVYVPYENDIQPCMSNGGSSPCGGETEGEPGTKITGVPKIKNGGNTKTPSNTQWVITKWEVPNHKENIPAPTQIDNEEKDPCKHYRSKFDNAAANCGVVAKSGSGDNSIGANATLTNFGNISAIQNFSVPENAQIGTRFCFAISVSPRTLKDSDTSEKQAQVAGKEWRHSAPLCFKVVKKPKLQVWGGGIFSNKGIKASSSVYDTKGTFSSWSEFEAMTGRDGRIISFNSASSNTQTKLNFGSASAGWENLISRNKDGHIAAITALYGSAAKNDPARRIAVENYTSPSVSLGGSANNTAQKYADGWTRVIYAKNLLIDGNIISRNNIANGVQQTIIVADNIRISNKVDRIDAWLITRGNGVVNTCAQNVNNDTISYVNEANCSRQLTINGPILTNRFLPWRTAYSDIKNPDKPSEIINQRADSYLWANKQTSAASRTIRTTYSKELPIRY